MLYIKDNIVKDGSRIVVVKDGYQVINPTREMILEDGWSDYEPEPMAHVSTIDEQLRDMLLDEYNKREDISDEEALKRPLLVYDFERYVGGQLNARQVVSRDGKLYRVRQAINPVLANHEPSLDTAALYETIDVSHDGTADDPIPYDGNMALKAGKHYSQGGMTYLCNRSTTYAVYSPLAELVGIYVETV